MNDADRKAFETAEKAMSCDKFSAGWKAACEWKDSQVLRTTEEDPCPACRPNTVCRTPSCGRLKGKRQEPITPPTAQINQPVIAKIADDLALTLHKLLQKNYKFRPFSSDHPDIEAAEKALLEYQKEMSRQFSEQFGGQD